MGLYKSTNEMFNNSSLYHSDEYLGNDYTDGIKHWKYIKREKKNGKWVYYYDQTDLNNARQNYNKAEINAMNSTAHKINARGDLRWAKKERNENRTYYDFKARDALERNHKYFDKAFGEKETIFNRKKLKGYKKKMNEASKEATKYEKEVSKLDKNYKKAKDKYDSTKKSEKKAWKAYDKADKKYDKERIKAATIGNLAKLSVKGLNAASNAKYNVSKKAKKAKKKISKYLSRK